MKINDRIHTDIDGRWKLLLEFGAFATALFGVKLWLIGAYGNQTPFWDQWNAEAANLYKPFFENRLGWADLFAAHNEHHIFTTRILALALIIINEIWNPLLQMVVNACLHIIALGCSIFLLTRVIGRNKLSAVLVFSLVLFGVPYAFENTLAGFQSQFYFLLLFSPVCLWLTTTKEPLTISWWSGVVCGILAFLSLASGVITLTAAAIIGIVYYLLGLRKTPSQLLGVGILIGLSTVGYALTPNLTYPGGPTATSFSQFFDALMAVLSWPMFTSAVSAIFRNVPALFFASILLWKRPSVNDRKWYLLSLVIWVVGQAASIAYGRAVGNLSSRYLDLFAINILVNFACLISLVQGQRGKHQGWSIIGMSVWTLTVMISLVNYAGENLLADLVAKRNSGLAQEINTRNYLATGDFGHLKDKPFYSVPYPVPEHLASILASPTIREILPTNIRRPLVPKLSVSTPAGAFVAGGFYPTTPKRADVTLGSYGVQGDATTGFATMQFEGNKHGAVVAIPVAGFPLSSGMKLEVEQNGQRKPVIIKSNPKESWTSAFVEVGHGAFALDLTDSSATTWLAVGAPVAMGRLDALTSDLLTNYLWFIMLGVVSALLLLLQSGLTSYATEQVNGHA